MSDDSIQESDRVRVHENPVTTIDEQLRLWVLGDPRHNVERDECCPDFSCCEPSLLAPKNVREAFVAADDDTRFSFLGGFLGASISKAAEQSEDDAPTVYIAGVNDPEATRQ